MNLNYAIDKFISSSLSSITLDSVKQLQVDIGTTNLYTLTNELGITAQVVTTGIAPYLILFMHENEYILKFDKLYTMAYLSTNNSCWNADSEYIYKTVNPNTLFNYDEIPVEQDGYIYNLTLTRHNAELGNELAVIDSNSRQTVFSIFSKCNSIYGIEYLFNPRFKNLHSVAITINQLPINIRKQVQAYVALIALRQENDNY